MLEWVTSTVNSFGYLGIASLMLLESVITPIPSELIMPLAGFTAAQGKLDFASVVVAGTVGSLLGALPWYYIGKRLGKHRLKTFADQHGKWLGLSSADVDKSIQWFNQYGRKAVFFCRLVPGIRTWISVPAGISRMHLGSFLFYSALGSLLWSSLLAYAGYALGNNYFLVEKYLASGSKIIGISLIVIFVLWLVKRRQQRLRQKR